MKLGWLSSGEKKILAVVAALLLVGLVAKWLPKFQVETPVLDKKPMLAKKRLAEANAHELKSSQKQIKTSGKNKEPGQTQILETKAALAESTEKDSAKKIDGEKQPSKTYIADKNTNNPNFSKNKSKKIDLNKADKAQLEKIKGIGPVLASAILKYRAQNGSFSSESDLLKVKGIGPKKLAKILEQAELLPAAK